MSGRIEKTVFISYRRTNLPWALAIYQNLVPHGYDIFFDYLSIDSIDFEKIIIENIKARTHFIVLLTPAALEGLENPTDLFRKEIEVAMDAKRNIIPLLLDGFDFSRPEGANLFTGKLAMLTHYNALRVPAEYFEESMVRLRTRFLNVALDTVPEPSHQPFIMSPIAESPTPPITEKHPLKVFLCHASQDKPIVRDFYSRLIADGFDAWLDEEKILPGQDWDFEIENAVENSEAVIIFLSDNSVNKEGYVQREMRFIYEIALEKPEGTIFIIPVRLNECQVPRRIRQYQYVDLFPVENTERAYKRLKDSLNLRARSLQTGS